ncbi:unnamed protein product [Adineta ricciae]|uniref:Uncharacterized protein n=1 Tax=Adineta ricciae TaxID=249248 RepID=A0A814PRB9_ADIRI|nr:unnamed protein product [Adineta ricciae]CAF1324733.1 unnamed protein product [Adineta ricciae]
MDNRTNSPINFVLASLSIFHGSLACVISLIIFIAIICYYYTNHRIKPQNKIIFILCANIYFILFASTLIVMISDIRRLLGDIYGYNLNSSSCVFNGYALCVILCVLYSSFTIQGFYRLCRVVYSSYRHMQTPRLYAFAIPIQIIYFCIIFSPLLIWHDISYIPTEYNCFIPATSVRGMLWLYILGYGLPTWGLMLMYLKISRYIYNQPHAQNTVVGNRSTRDIVVIQRIMILVGILLVLALPGTILLLIYYITGYECSFGYRLQSATLQISLLILSVLIVFMTPQLKNNLMTTYQKTRVVPMHTSESVIHQNRTRITLS